MSTVKPLPPAGDTVVAKPVASAYKVPGLERVKVGTAVGKGI
mgnify:CR=1 FL=1